MKTLISLMLIAFVTVSASTAVQAATQTKVVYVCKKHHKHYKHHKKYTSYRRYYVPGYCESTCTNGCVREACCPGYYYTCHTIYNYHRGHNKARVEKCE